MISTGLKIIDLVQPPNMDKELFLRVLKEREVVSVFCHSPLEIIAFEGYSSLVHGQWFIGNIITQDSLGSINSDWLTWQQVTILTGVTAITKTIALPPRVDGTQKPW